MADMQVPIRFRRETGRDGSIEPVLIDIGAWYLPIAVFIIVASANSINLTDGLDGLAGIIAATAFTAYGIIALLQEQDFLITFSFVVYLVPGLFGAPLKSLAGYLPPMSSHDFNISEIIRNENKSSAYLADENNLCEDAKYADFLELPHGLNGYFDYDQALMCAKESNKPIFIDFTGALVVGSQLAVRARSGTS